MRCRAHTATLSHRSSHEMKGWVHYDAPHFRRGICSASWLLAHRTTTCTRGAVGPLAQAVTLQHRISLRADLIGFIHMLESHTSEHLAEMFLYFLNRLQIANKVSFILILLKYIYMFYRLDGLLQIMQLTILPAFLFLKTF